MDKIVEWARDVERIITTKDYDWVHVNVGPERIGKSNLSILIGIESNPRFKDKFPDQMVFGIDEFKQAIKNSQPGDVIIPDEGALMFFSRDAMSRDVKEGIKMLTAMGVYNLFIIINVPNFWIIDKYIREHRVRSVTHVVRRGWVHYYGPKKVRLITQDKNKAYKTIWPDYDFRDAFGKVDPVLWARYVDKKKNIVAGRSTEVTAEKDKEFNKTCSKCGYKWHFSGFKRPRCPICNSSKVS